jgi:transcriptional regulator with XRE-family HTH domain
MMLSKYNVTTKSILVAKKISPLTAYGPTLAKYREDARLTQEQLAVELGITRVTLAGWEGQVEVKLTEEQVKTLKTLLRLDDPNVLTIVPHGTEKQDVLDHPVIRSLVVQSDYIMKRVTELEEENKKLKSRGD